MTNIVHNIVQHDPNDKDNDPIMVHIEHYLHTYIFDDNQVAHENLRNQNKSYNKYVFVSNHLLDMEISMISSFVVLINILIHHYMIMNYIPLQSKNRFYFELILILPFRG
jgi:hypothetical protein